MNPTSRDREQHAAIESFCPAPVSATAPRVPRVVAALQRHTELADEVRAAVGALGVTEHTRWTLAILGTMVFAARTGCRPPDVREAVRRFVWAALGEHADDAVRTRCAESAAAVVDALYLVTGDDVSRTDPAAVLRVAEISMRDEGAR